MIEIRNRLTLLPLTLSLFAAAIPMAAQTTPPAATTCATAPTSITALSLERVLTLSNILTTITPNVPTNILASIAGGAVEVRTRLIYNPQQNTLTETTFLVASGSPIPTPLGVDVTSGTIQNFTINVSQIFSSCAPTPSLLIVGKIAASGISPFGNYNGSIAAVSIGYTTDTPAKINNVVELVSGVAVAYSAAGQGTLTFPSVPVTPPGSSSGTPTVVLNPPPPASGSFQVFQNPYHVDASTSTDPNKLALTYVWTSDKPVNFLPSNAVASPDIQFDSGKGDYTITVTVTNSAGQSASASFVVQYLGR